MDLEVRHNPERSRYELHRDGRLIGVADYRMRGDVAVFSHTEIVVPLRDQGFGEELVRVALDDARRQAWRVVPSCSFVAQYIDDHPEYRDLLAA